MKMIIALVLTFMASHAMAADVAPLNQLANTPTLQVQRVQLGSGAPSNSNSAEFDIAVPVANDLYSVPGFMPGWPTAASMWAKVVTVDCERSVTGALTCGGYNINVAQLERGEYIYVKPVIHEAFVAVPIVIHEVTPPAVLQIFTPPHVATVFKRKKIVAPMVCTAEIKK